MDRNRARAIAALPAIAALLAGCQAAPSGSAALPASGAATSPIGPAASQTSVPKPTLDMGPAVRLTLDTSGPIVASTDGIAGHPYANPAAAARDRNGGYVLFIVWFGDAPDDQVVTVARSTDGHAWRLGKTPIYTDLGMHLAHPGPGPIPAAAVQLDDGSWQLYGWAAHAETPQSFSSWRASAPKPEGPWTLDAPVVLSPGPSSAWDGQTAAVGAVQHMAAGYAMWYEGQGPGSGVRGDIGYATSADGLTWRKLDDPTTTNTPLGASDPVIHRGVCGPGTLLAVYQPEVQAAPGGFLGAVGAYGSTGSDFAVYGLTSPDGKTWRCGSTSPILKTADIPGSQGIHTLASMSRDDGTVALLVESLGDKHSDIWLATLAVAP